MAVLGGHKDLYWFGLNVHTSSLLMLMLPTLFVVGVTNGREREPVPYLWCKDRMLAVEAYGHYVLETSCLRSVPFQGRPSTPFIEEEEDTGYMRERER